MTLTLSIIQAVYLEKINIYLKTFVNSYYSDDYQVLRDLFNYHLCLNEPAEQQGKRIRPLLTLICASGAGVHFEKAMPAASAIELIHNFSLIHDDIEDNGSMRRGKPSVWKKWGIAQGLNGGDAMFNAAFAVLHRLSVDFSPEIFVSAYEVVTETCSCLTKGQFLDIGFEDRLDVTIDDYFRMIEGKTAALLSCATQMGAILADLDSEQIGFFRSFGYALGIAFQIYDDWLGVWGKEDKVGKSIFSDILEKKKSLPILLGIKQSERIRNTLNRPALSQKDAEMLSVWLREDGIEDAVVNQYTHWTKQALHHLNKMKCDAVEKGYLEEITNKLLMREK